MLETYKSRLNKMREKSGNERERRRLELIDKFFDICDELSDQLGADTADAEYTPANMQRDVAVERLKVLKDHIQLNKEVLQANKEIHEHFLDRIQKKLNLLGSKSDDG